MQFRNFFTYLLLGALFLLSTSAEAQKITTNELGEKIVVYPDGTWRYFDESLNEDVQVANDMEMEKDAKKSKRQKRKDRKKSKKKKSDKKNKKKRGKKKSKKGKKKNNVVSSQEEERARKEAILHAEWAVQEEERARKIEEDLTFARIFLEEDLEESYNSVDVAPEKIDEIETQLAEVKAKEKMAKAERKQASKRADQAEKMIDMKKSKRDKLLAKMEKQEAKEQASALDAIAEPLSEEATSSIGVDNNEDEGWYKGNNNKSLAKYNKKDDVMYHPPTTDCEFGFDDIDEFTGKRRIELAKRTFFTHTSDRLKPYFKNNHHITCEGFLSAATGSGGKYLNLKISILSEHAQREFGLLEKGSILSLKLINGSTVKLLNTKTTPGQLNKVTKTTVYRGQYLISKDHEKSLKKSEVDKVRVVWGTGYEDYEVYELDFFIDQFKCLNNK